MNGFYLKQGRGLKASMAKVSLTAPPPVWNSVIWFDLGVWEWKRFVTQLPDLIFLGNQKPYLLAADQRHVWLFQWIFFVS